MRDPSLFLPRHHLRIVLDVAAPIIQTIALDGSTLKLDDQS
jgi:hypothetical protein